MKYPYPNPIAWLIAALTLLLVSCGPPRVEPLKEIEANQTAFVVPLEGTTGDQQKFESIEFLQSQQVATKRIIVPVRKRSLGRMYWSYEWVETQRVIVVDRTPITRSWTENPRDSQQKRIQASQSTFGVESRDSIGFQVGVNVSAYIEEKDAAKYLYYYRGNSLTSVIDSNIREKVHTVLSREFASRNLQEIKVQKVQITEALQKDVADHFLKYGITITSIGLAEGLDYEQTAIQDAINAAYIAEMAVERQIQEVRKQEEVNKQMILEAQGQQEQARIFAETAEERKKLVALEVEKMRAEALVEAVKRWNGTLPKFMTGGDSGMSFLMPIDKE